MEQCDLGVKPIFQYLLCHNIPYFTNVTGMKLLFNNTVTLFYLLQVPRTDASTVLSTTLIYKLPTANKRILL